MKTTVNLDDDLVRRAMSIHQGKTKTAVLELGLRELINSHQRRKLSEAFGSQPELSEVQRHQAAADVATGARYQDPPGRRLRGGRRTTP